jgi:hypothetical protein
VHALTEGAVQDDQGLEEQAEGRVPLDGQVRMLVTF